MGKRFKGAIEVENKQYAIRLAPVANFLLARDHLTGKELTDFLKGFSREAGIAADPVYLLLPEDMPSPEEVAASLHKLSLTVKECRVPVSSSHASHSLATMKVVFEALEEILSENELLERALSFLGRCAAYESECKQGNS